MRGTIWEWNVEKLEGGGSQILQTSHLHGVTGKRSSGPKDVEKKRREKKFFKYNRDAIICL